MKEVFTKMRNVLIVIFTIAFIASLGYSYYITNSINLIIEDKIKMQQLQEQQIKENKEKYDRQLKEIKESIDLINEKLEAKSNKNKVSIDKIGYFHEDSNLKEMPDVSEEDMNRLIRKWNQYTDCSEFLDKGDVFIKAAEETGYNPIYLFAHAATESTWGRSHIAKTKANYFGINCIDTNPNLGLVMGDGVETGIINGAIWIDNNFYQNGYITLSNMKDGNYASSPSWSKTIVSIVNQSYEFLKEDF